MKSLCVFSAFFAFWFLVTFAGTICIEEDAYRENIRKLALANNELAFNLHRRFINGSSRNMFFSPLSLSTVFGMLFCGARGNTSQELRETLGYEKAALPDYLVHDTFNRYLREKLRRTNSSYGYVLFSANTMLVDEQLGLLDEYRRKVQELYRATVRDVNSMEENQIILKNIDDYVGEKKNGKINNLLFNLDPSTVFVLLNAMYFKGTWKNKFQPKRTKEEIFYNNGLGSKERKVPFMNLRTKIPYASLDNFQAIELPYRGGDISMLILLPMQRDGLQDLEETLTPEVLDDIQRLLYPSLVHVSLPKFKLEFQKELTPEVQAVGAKQIFSPGADFSGMTSGNNLKISEVYHKVAIEVNELGSEAAAVTKGSSCTNSGTFCYCGPPEFNADHPFLFAVLEKGHKSSMILFLGRVNNL